MDSNEEQVIQEIHQIKKNLEPKKVGMELLPLKNMSRGKCVGFFEASNFHPDFILWLLVDGKQYVTFLKPHDLLHVGPASEKVLSRKQFKEVERRLQAPTVTINSFILPWRRHPQLKWDNTQDELEEIHVLFMTETDTSTSYLPG